ncbi:hypothetical protein ES703_88032 [subsurface metagenome]
MLRRGIRLAAWNNIHTGSILRTDVFFTHPSYFLRRDLFNLFKVGSQVAPANLDFQGCHGSCQRLVAPHPVQKIALIESFDPFELTS